MTEIKHYHVGKNVCSCGIFCKCNKKYAWAVYENGEKFLESPKIIAKRLSNTLNAYEKSRLEEKILH